MPCGVPDTNRFQNMTDTLPPLHEILPPLHEIMTGRPRPRHLRFAAALADLAPGTVLERRDHSRLQRLQTNARCRLYGLREVGVPAGEMPVLLHQALTSVARPYAAEFDVPLAVHGYNYQAFLRHRDRARRLFESPSLRALFVFSDWARRSFAMHFGEETAAKCKISYPLASMQSNSSRLDRRYDFAFIAANFRIKGGPEMLRAFRSVRQSVAPHATLCVVSDLKEAHQYVGDLSSYEGVEWRSSNLDETAVAALLSETHCLVHPTLFDSFGVVVLEALAAGCAIIATNMASLSELVTSENGFLLSLPIGGVVGDMTIPQFSIGRDYCALLDRLSLHSFERDLTAAMAALVSDQVRREKCQAAARDLYRKRFSLEAWTANMRTDLRTAFPELNASRQII